MLLSLLFELARTALMIWLAASLLLLAYAMIFAHAPAREDETPALKAAPALSPTSNEPERPVAVREHFPV